MNHIDKLRKISKAMALAGNNPTTPEEKNAYTKAREMVTKLIDDEPPVVHKHTQQKTKKPTNHTHILDNIPLLSGKVKTVRKISWFELLDPKYVHIRISPDSSVRNWRSEDICRTIADQFCLPIDRISKEGGKIQFRMQDNASFEIVLNKGKVSFYLSVPETIAPVMIRRMQSVWNGATIEIDQDYSPIKNPMAVYELVYKRHDLYSLHTDATNNDPLQSIMESGRMVGEKDEARIFAYMQPIHQPSWYQQLSSSWTNLREGKSPKKWQFSFRFLAQQGAIGISALLREVVTSVAELFSNGKDNRYAHKPVDPEASKFSIGQLSRSTAQKTSKPAIKTSLWVCATSKDKVKADMIARTVANSFGDLAADNELEPKKLKGKQMDAVAQTMRTNKPPKIRINYNLMSTAEVSKIVQVPGRDLQEQFPEIQAVHQKEVEADARITKGGMELGVVNYRGTTTRVYQPINNWDEACLPNVVIGGMGSGKTKGFASNWIVNAVKNGYGAMMIDPAKGEAGNEVETALPADQIIRIKLGQVPISLDWNEVKYSKKARNRLANTVIGFFNSATDEAGAQTARYLRAAVMAMQTGKLSEIMLILEDKKYGCEAIQRLKEGSIHRTTLADYWSETMSDAKRAQIFAPILNRLDTILGDEYLSECMESDNVIDMVGLMSQRKAVIIDVPKSDLGTEAVDLIVNLLSTKIDLAMTLRKEENQFPFWVIFDEPHQFLRSAKIWKAAAVESRKWRIGYVWMFHSWEQIPRDLAEIIKSAGPHYHLYSSSKKTFKDLAEEIAPFKIEDAIRLPSYHAINIIRASGEVIKPFIAKMSNPPSKQ